MLWPLAKQQVAVNVVMPVLAAVPVFLRVLARRKTKLGLYADDYVIFASLLLALGICITGIWAGARNYLGKELLAMTLKEYSMYQKILRIDALLCYVAFALVKISILLFYKRVFPVQKFKWICNAMIGVVVGYSIGVILAQIFSQKPFDRGWDLPPTWNPVTDYHPTFNFTTYLIAVSIVNMSLDIMILALPVPLIYSLHMSSAKRLSVLVIFGTGAFCVVASAARIYFCSRAYQIMHFIKQPYTITEIAVWNDMWAHIEVCAAIVAACLPTLAPLVKGQDPHASKIALTFASWSTRFSSYRRIRSHDAESRAGSAEFFSPIPIFSPQSKKTSMTVIETPVLPDRFHYELPAQPQVIYVQKGFGYCDVSTF